MEHTAAQLRHCRAHMRTRHGQNGSCHTEQPEEVGTGPSRANTQHRTNHHKAQNKAWPWPPQSNCHKEQPEEETFCTTAHTGSKQGHHNAHAHITQLHKRDPYKNSVQATFMK